MRRVNVGDIIQYRYRIGGGFTNHDARVVEMIDDAGYWVAGGYLVATKDVLTVIPQRPAELTTENSKLETALNADFPMEANQ
jgi:hypothetical protein